MTSDRTDKRILKDPSGQPSVEQNVGSIGGHDRLNEAPQCKSCGIPMILTPTVLQAEILFECACGHWEWRMRDGHPGFPLRLVMPPRDENPVFAIIVVGGYDFLSMTKQQYESLRESFLRI